MPDSANRPLQIPACFAELRRSSFFERLPDEWLLPIAERVNLKTFAAGESVTEDGDSLSSFYVMLSGSTTVYIHDKVVGTIVGGECIGEGVFFAKTNILRTATVEADGEVVVAEINKENIASLLADEKLMAYMNKALLLALFKKLQGANRRIQDLTLDL